MMINLLFCSLYSISSGPCMNPALVKSCVFSLSLLEDQDLISGNVCFSLPLYYGKGLGMFCLPLKIPFK